ncbi:MAG TPA: cupin domain-containing protein [Thermohalobaculum sp.]|nr:cupin domain-containing protein [Thermohalobaculum sp.]
MRMSTVLLSAALVSATVLASLAARGDESTTPLLKTELQGFDGLEANMAVVDVGPGFVTERHLHPGHVFLYVLEGEIEINIDGQPPLRVAAGEAVHELPNQPMIGRNASSSEGARFVLFQVGKSGEPLTVPQPE